MVTQIKIPFPKLVGWKPTRETLHAYSRVLSAIRAAFTPEQPRFQHISLRLYTAGLTTTPIPHPADPKRNFALSMDLRNHYILLSTSDRDVQQFRMSEGLSATYLGELLLEKLAELEIRGKVDKQLYADEKPRHYALDAAERYFAALSHAGRIFEQFKAKLKGETDPVQLWPHQFDLSFALLGNQQVKTLKGDTRSQILFGFATEHPGLPSTYFYASPTPFEETLTHKKLPKGAVWHTAVWQGALLPYAEVAEREDGEKKLVEFLQGAYKIEKALI